MPNSYEYKPSPMAAAMRWVHRISSISMEMVLPIGLGYWLDTKWNTSPWLLILGAAFGFGLAAVHLKQLIVSLEESQRSAQRQKNSASDRISSKARQTDDDNNPQTPSSP